MDNEIDDIEGMQRWIALVINNAKDAGTDRVKLGMDVMLAGVSQMGTAFE